MADPPDEATASSVSFNPLDPALSADPYPVYERLREQGDFHEVAGLGMYAAVGYESALQVLKEPGGDHRYVEFQKVRVGPDAPDEPYCRGAADFVLMKSGEDHKRVRGAFIRAFTRHRVDSMRDQIRRTAHDLIDAFAVDREAEIIESFAMKLPLRTISQMLEVPESDQDEIVDLMEGFALAMQWLPMDERQVAMANEAISGLESYFTELVAERRRAPGDDLLSALIEEADAGHLTERELIANAWGLYAAGHETTGAAIGNAIIALVEHPDQLKLLLDDPSLIPGAVDEIMRFRGLSQATQRSFGCPVEIAGRTVPENTPVLAYLASGNRDESVVPDPDRFDIRREQPVRHLSFSGGAHTCAGQHLAVSEMECAIEALFTRLEGISIGEIDWNEEALMFQGPRRMQIAWTGEHPRPAVP
jgi:cytochrome P450